MPISYSGSTSIITNLWASGTTYNFYTEEPEPKKEFLLEFYNPDRYGKNWTPIQIEKFYGSRPLSGFTTHIGYMMGVVKVATVKREREFVKSNIRKRRR